jgi:hypothetical protein
VRSWEALWALIDANGVAPVAHRGLHALGLAGLLPASVHLLFARRSAQVGVEAAARLAIALPVLSALAASGIGVAVLKGAYLGAIVHRDPAYKRMNDLDLLVATRDLDAVYALYAVHGLAPPGKDRLGAGRGRLTHHGPPVGSRDLACVIDTQWSLVSPLAGYRVDVAGLWSRARPLDFHGVGVRTLAPEDHLHHLCLHLGTFKTAIADLADLYNLLRHHRAGFDWQRFLGEVERTGSAARVYHALALAGRLCPMLELAEVVRLLEPRAGRRARWLTKRKTRSLGVALRVATDHLELIQRDLATLRAAAGRRERRAAFRRLWRDVLRPPPAVAVKLALGVPGPRAAPAGARLLAPWRIVRAFAGEVGFFRVVFFALTSVAIALRRRPDAAAAAAVARDPSR